MSHNKDDGSHLIRDELARLGAKAWHDGYADITNRAVQARITGALAESRYICVCVGDAFRDSDWVKVEYRTGLATEHLPAVSRVLVLATGAAPTVPDELGQHRVFDVHSHGLKELAAHLIAENARPAKGSSAPEAGSAEDIRLHVVRGLRSRVAARSHFKLSVLELARLARERLVYQLANPSDGDVVFTLTDIIWRIDRDEHRHYSNTYFRPAEAELRTIVLDLFESFASHREHVRALPAHSLLSDRYDCLDPLIELMTYPDEVVRARRVFDAMCAVLENEWRKWPHVRSVIPNFRWSADQVLSGASLTSAQERRNAMIRKGRLPPGTPIWQRLLNWR